jgi:hypothetical protein
MLYALEKKVTKARHSMMTRIFSIEKSFKKRKTCIKDLNSKYFEIKFFQLYLYKRIQFVG